MLTRRRLKEARKLEKAVTPGPWEQGSHEMGRRIFTHEADGQEYRIGLTDDYDESDAAFIAASRTIVPAALDTIEALMSLVEELAKVHCHDQWKQCGGTCPPCLA